MIDLIDIRNFQVHKKRTIELSPCITTIVGPTDEGKSAVLRALKWVALNQPSGEDFKRWGAKTIRVGLQVGDHLIERIRGRQNLYKVDGEKYAAFGRTGVPTEVSSILNLDETNFQGQFDSPFWFGETAGEVSRQLNRILDLEIIDTTLANLVKEIRKTKAEVEVRTERVREAKETKRQLSSIKQMKKAFAVVEKWEGRRDRTAQKRTTLASHIQVVVKYQGTEYKARAAMTAGEQAIRQGDRWQKYQAKRKTLGRLLKRAAELREIAEQKAPDMSKLAQLAKEYQIIEEERTALGKLIAKVDQEGERVCQNEECLARRKKEFRTRLGKICPLCGNRIRL